MRILMLSWRGPSHPAAGGAEHYTRRVLAGLVARGHAATWFCEGPRAEVLDGVRVVAGGRVPAVYLAGALWLQRHASAFDVVVDQINGVGFLTPLYSPLPVLALIHQLAGPVWRYEQPPPVRWIGPPLERLLLTPYRGLPFVTVSRTTERDLRALGWRGPAFVAPNGADRPAAAVQPPKERGPTLVFLGRWQAAAKRLPHALAAFARLREGIPGAQLWVIGRGRPPRRRPPPGVTFFADVSDELRDSLLARAWLLVATSVREGWGRMVLEAALQGTPAAVYAVPGLEEAGRALGAVVVAPRPQALVQAVAPLLRDPEHLRAMGARARAAASTYTWDRALAVWEDALAAVGRP